MSKGAIVLLWPLLAAWTAMASGTGPSSSQDDPAAQASSLEAEAASALAHKDWAVAAALSRTCAERFRELGDIRGEVLCLLGLGLAEQRRGNKQPALDALLEGLSASAQDPASADLRLSDHLLLAEIYLSQLRTSEAMVHLETGLSLARSLKDRFSEAVFLERMGYRELQTEQWKDAESHLTAALAIAQELPEQGHLLWLCLHHSGVLYQKQGRFSLAAELFEKAVKLAQGQGLHSDETASLQSLGAVNLLLQEYAKALGAFEAAEAQLMEADDQSKLWGVRKQIAEAFAHLGKPAHALTLYEEAIQHYREVDEEWELPSLLAGAARVLAREGRSREQRSFLEEALCIWRKLGNRLGEARILSQLGNLELENSSYEEAVKKFEEALSLSRSVGSKTGEAEALFNSAHLYFDLGRHEEAHLRYEQVLRIARDLNNLVLEASALRDIARIEIALGRLADASVRIEEALMIARRIGNPSEEVAGLTLQGQLLGFQGKSDEAFIALSNALLLSKKRSDPLEKLRVLVAIGLLQLSRGNPAAAVRTFNLVLEERRSAGSSFQEEVMFKLLAIAYQDQGQVDLSIEYYRKAFEGENAILDRTSTDDLLMGMTSFQTEVAQPLIELLVASGRGEEAFAVAERSRSRALLRQMGNHRIDPLGSVDGDLVREEQRLREALSNLNWQMQSELRQPFDRRNRPLLETLTREIDERQQQYETLLIHLKQTNPEYASLVRPEPLPLPEVQSLIGKETALVEYFVLPEQTLAWVIDRESSHLVRLPLTERALDERTTAWRELLMRREPDAEPATALYRDLIAPLEPYLSRRSLLVVPHGPLHRLPFAALRHSSGVSLVERHPLVYLPSASVLPFLARKRSPSSGRLLVLGDPDGSLPHAAAEARAVASLYGTEALLGRQANETALKERSHGMDVLHLAAHATFDPARPLFSRIRLAPGGRDDGDLEMHEVFGLDLTGTNLVVLSGCDTGRGSLTRGDDVLGWSRAFLYTGAPAALTTLWPIDDEASEALMTSFHRHLRAGLSSEEALQRAQVETAREERWRSPYFWSGFTLVGDPGEGASAPERRTASAGLIQGPTRRNAPASTSHPNSSTVR